MTPATGFEIFLAAPPGLEEVLLEEVRTKGFRQPRAVPGGVVLRGRIPLSFLAPVWRRLPLRWLQGLGRHVFAVL